MIRPGLICGFVFVLILWCMPVTTASTLAPHSASAKGAGLAGVRTAFVIVMENHDWWTIEGSEFCPFINQTLLPMASYAREYYGVPGLHPSEPNYLWMVAGTNFGILNNASPVVNHQTSTNTLFHQLDAAGIPWKSYMEDVSGTDIAVVSYGQYAAWHNPCVFFDPAASDLNYSTNHVRPFGELAADLAGGRAPRFCFIKPNLTNDMHTLAPGSVSPRKQGDDWLARELPAILNSGAYTNGGVVFITWDESDYAAIRPIGLIALSPQAKGFGYHNSKFYTHSSLLRTLQDIYGLQPYLGDAVNAVNLSDLFASLAISKAEWRNDGMHLVIRYATVGQTYKLQATEDLSAEWRDIAISIAPAAEWELVDSRADRSRTRFYRVAASKP